MAPRRLQLLSPATATSPRRPTASPAISRTSPAPQIRARPASPPVPTAHVSAWRPQSSIADQTGSSSSRAPHRQCLDLSTRTDSPARPPLLLLPPDLHHRHPDPRARRNFPMTCQDCHPITAWRPRSRSHRHRSPSPRRPSGHRCANCHAAGYAGTLTDCLSVISLTTPPPAIRTMPTSRGPARTATRPRLAAGDDRSQQDRLPAQRRPSGASAPAVAAGATGTPTDAIPAIRALHRRPQSEPRRLPEVLPGLPRRLRMAAGDFDHD